MHFHHEISIFIPGGIAQLVTCLATDTYLTVDLGVMSEIQTRSHNFVEIDHERIVVQAIYVQKHSFSNIYGLRFFFKD